MTKKAIIYTRVSTEEQAEHGYSLQTQIEACQRYAEQNGMAVIASPKDEGVSGATLDRPGLAQVRELVRAGQADAVIVYNADRLSRNLVHALILRDEFRHAGIERHTVRRGQANESAEDALLESVEAAFAEFERLKIGERTRRGMKAKARAGKWVGHGAEPFGYRREGKGRDVRLNVHEPEAAIVRGIFNDYAGASRVPLRAIVNALNKAGTSAPGRDDKSGPGKGRGWHVNTVKRLLRQPIYAGRMVSQGETIPMPQLAIVDATLWAVAQERLRTNRNQARPQHTPRYLLTGHLKCTCKHSMCGKRVRRGQHQYRYYVCSASMQPRTMRVCDESPIHADEAEGKVWNAVVGLLDAEKIERAKQRLIERQTRDAESPHAKRIASVAADMTRVERKMQRQIRRADDEEERGNKSLAETYREEARIVGRELDGLRAHHDRMIAEQEQGRAATERMQIALASVEQIQRDIAEADAEGRAYVFDKLDVHCTLHHVQAGTRRAIKVNSLAGEATVLHGSAATCQGQAARRRAGRIRLPIAP